MLLRPTHSRVIMPAAITGRDSTARYSAMRGPTAAWRAMAQGGPHQEAMAISLSDLDCSPQMTRTAMKRAPVTAVLTDRPSMLRPEMKSPTAVPAARMAPKEPLQSGQAAKVNPKIFQLTGNIRTLTRVSVLEALVRDDDMESLDD
jgi:hypothetical protein